MGVNEDGKWMAQALLLAEKAGAQGEVPVGAVIVFDDQIIGQGYNLPISRHDATAHAEILAIRQAGQYLGNYRLKGATLYVTLEPCAMCAGAIVHARLDRLVYGALEPKAGAICSAHQLLQHPSMNYRVESVGGVMGAECGQVISSFFSSRRADKKKQKQASLNQVNG